jgi:hypothetical protein
VLQYTGLWAARVPSLVGIGAIESCGGDKTT